jgi:hypothetical protein
MVRARMSTKAVIEPFPVIPLISLIGFLWRGGASGPVWQIFYYFRSLNSSHFAEPVLGLSMHSPWPVETNFTPPPVSRTQVFLSRPGE